MYDRNCDEYGFRRRLNREQSMRAYVQGLDEYLPLLMLRFFIDLLSCP
jgi:hypothetical protein